MRILLFALLLLTPAASFAQDYFEVNHYVGDYPDVPQEQGYRYLLADKVTMRNGPGTDSPTLASLPIGAKVVLLERSPQQTVVNELKSAWYKVDYNGKRGWVWGGLIATYAAGSQTNSDIKFLGGISGYKWNADSTWRQLHYQIRAVKDGQQLDKIEVPSFGRGFQQLSNIGKRGMNEVDDILLLHVPCDGGCGCSTGDIVIFWANGSFHHVEDLIGTADADYSDWVSYIYPSDMEGIPNTIIRRFASYDDATDEEYEQGILKRFVEDSFWQWNGVELVETARPRERVEYTLEVGY